MTSCRGRIASAFWPAWCAVILLLLSPEAWGQGRADLIIFDEDDAVGVGYYDASFGTRFGASTLTLAGGSADKLPINALHAVSGTQSGLLQWKSATGGNWSLFVASPGWAGRDASGYDSLVLFLNGPVAIDTSALPLMALESTTNAKSSSVALKRFLVEGIDADSATWQRVSVPLTAFEPYGAFSLSAFKDFWFSQGLSDNQQHTVWFDDVRIVGPADTTVPLAVKNPVTRWGDRSVVLHWDPNPEKTLQGYNVYRSMIRSGPFTKISVSPVQPLSFADPSVSNGGVYHYYVRAVGGSGVEGPSSDTVQAFPEAFASDEAFLDYVQRTAIDFFWYEANPANGLVRDRSQPGSPSSIAAVGFGLTSLCVGVDRGWIARAAAADRVRTTLQTFWRGPQGTAASGTIGHKGFFYHFLDMNTATRMISWAPEISSIDTGLLLAGILYVAQFFDGGSPVEDHIRQLADSIYARVDWQWMQNGGATLTHGWKPESGFLPYRWTGYSEAMILYLLAIGAPANAIPGSSWNGWTSSYSWQTHYTYSFVNFPPLFGHQYSHCWVDFRNIADAYMLARGITYAENTRRATLAQRLYCIANPGSFPGYGADIWGLTACDGPSGASYLGYSARGAPPAQNDDGTLAPTAAAGSMPFTPEVSIAALRAMYDQYRTTIWTGYGFCDAFNLKANWWDTDVIGIDQGPIAIMIENHRSGAVWSRFMRNPNIQTGLQGAGFTTVTDVPEVAVPTTLALEQNYPNPFNPMTTIRFALPPGLNRGASLRVYDNLGRLVATLVSDDRPAGIYSVTLDASRLASGTYYYRLQSAGAALTRRLTVLK